MTKQEIIKNVMIPVLKAGFDIYFVGGCVRDSYLGIEPKDFDLVTEATPVDLHNIFKVFSNQNSEPFGVTMPIIEGELIEIATMRKDITKGRHPKIEFTDNINEDAMRRDFTCNALYEDIHGNVIDPTGHGKADVACKRLAFVGNPVERVTEDPLRMFRFCRFMAQKGFKPSLPHSARMQLISLACSKGFYEEVSNERKLKELIGIFGGEYFMKPGDETFAYLTSFSVLESIPKMQYWMQRMFETKQNPKWHSEGDVFIHTVMTMEAMAMQPHDWVDMMAAFLHDIGKPVCAERCEKKNPEDNWFKMKDHPEVGAPGAYQICKDMGMSNADSETIRNLVLHHMDMHRFTEWSSKFKKKELLHNKDIDRLIKLCRADERGCVPVEPDEWPSIDEALAMADVKELMSTPMPEPWITGEDLIKAGCKPGPGFKKALDVAYKMQVDGHETDPKHILSTVLSLAK